MNYKIREAQSPEAEILSDLAFRSKAYWGYSTEFMALCRDELTYTAEQIQGDRFCFFVAARENSILGFYAIEWRSPDAAELEGIFVEPWCIGQGVGRALIEHAKNKAREFGASTLLVQSDPNAEGFYLAAGGHPIGQRESDSIPGRYLPILSISLQT